MGNLLLRGFVAGVDFGGVKKLGQRALDVARLATACGPWSCVPTSRDPHPGQRDLESRIFGILGKRLLKVVEGRVVVLARLGGLALLEVGVGRLGMQPRAARSTARYGGQQRNGENELSIDPAEAGAGVRRFILLPVLL